MSIHKSAPMSAHRLDAAFAPSSEERMPSRKPLALVGHSGELEQVVHRIDLSSGDDAPSIGPSCSSADGGRCLPKLQCAVRFCWAQYNS